MPGNSYPTLINGSLGLFDGTSASAPAFAAMISLLNAEQSRRGQPPLGLLNPWLYGVHAQHPEAFTDIVVGDTGSTEELLCGLGFRAAPGWDPATGLGEPRLAVLRKLLPKRQAANIAQPAGPVREERLSASGLPEQPVAGLSGGAFLGAVALVGAGAALLALLAPRADLVPSWARARSLGLRAKAEDRDAEQLSGEAGYCALLGHGDARQS